MLRQLICKRLQLLRSIGCCVRGASASSTSATPERTSLYDFHVKNGGKIVDFSGYLLPVKYDDQGIAASHLHTRKNASIFDVSHMLQTYIRGKDCVECIESICTANIRDLNSSTGTLTVFTNENGGILDDLIVTKVSDRMLYIVSNAAMKSQDMNIMQSAVNSFKAKGKYVDIEFLPITERSLLALQGPLSVKLLESCTKYDLSKLFFMQTTEMEIFGVKGCRVTRCGYTGEDGIEISVPSDKAVLIVEGLLAIDTERMKLAGLGARDSLRLEAGLCLYGTDIDANTTPVEAALSWLVAKRRRSEGNFPGAHKINEQLRSGVDRRRVGFHITNGPPARHGAKIYLNDEPIGVVTSGCPSPSAGGNIGMAYIKEEFKKSGLSVDIKVRDRAYAAELVKMPFVTTNYYMKAKK